MKWWLAFVWRLNVGRISLPPSHEAFLTSLPTQPRTASQLKGRKGKKPPRASWREIRSASLTRMLGRETLGHRSLEKRDGGSDDGGYTEC